jgi:hypothetical protein
MNKSLKKIRGKKKKTKTQKGNGGCQSMLISSGSTSSSSSNSITISDRLRAAISNIAPPIVDAREIIEISPDNISINHTSIPTASAVSCNNYKRKSRLNKKHRNLPNKRKRTKRRIRTNTKK